MRDRKPWRAVLACLVFASGSLAVVSLTAGPASATGTFTDDDGNRHEAMIEELVSEGITEGCDASGTLYCPARAVTRAQMASFIVRTMTAAGIAVDQTADDAFSDDDGSEHEEAINALAADGVVQGSSDGLYRPKESVTRGQMALFLTRAFELPPGEDAGFTDVAAVYVDAVNAIHSAGITTGCSADGTRYCTSDPVRRDQMASFLIRTLRNLSGEAPPPPGETDNAAPAEPPDIQADQPGDPTATGEGDPADAPPTDDGSDVVVYPAAAGSGGDPATSMPPPDEVPDRPMTEWDSPVHDDGRTADPGDAGAFMYQNEPVFRYDAAGYLPYDSLPTQVGRIQMFVDGALTNTCSGTVVDRHLVLTAAHCVDKWDCFRFFPDQYGTQAKYGYWDSCRAWYPTNFNSTEAWRWVYDYALISFPPNASGYVGDVVGTQRILMDAAGLNLAKYNIGYPVEGWYSQGCTTNSCYPWYCWAPDPGNAGRYHWGNGWTSIGWGCDAAGGISGGPVFALYNNAWWVVSVNSTMGHTVPCSTTCASSRNVWYMRNMWGAGFRSGAFDTFWNEVVSFG